MKLNEVIDIKPDERERLGLPSYVTSFLPKAQAMVGSGELPVEVKEEKWKVVEVNGCKRLTRTFKFSDVRVKAAFILEIMDYEESAHHHGKITMFENRVKVEVWTKDIDAVTELDIDYKEEVDSILQDVKHQFKS